jgi:hypothetical protein
MAFSNDTRDFLLLIAQECVDVASRTSIHVAKDVQKTTLLINIINADLRAEDPNQCMDCMSLFLDPSIVRNPNTKDNLPLSTYIRTGPCGALCMTTIDDLRQEATIIVDTVTDIPFTVSPEKNQALVSSIYDKLQDRDVSYLRKVTKDQIGAIVGGLDWATPMNDISASSAASIINLVTAEGTGVRMAHIAQTSVVDAVFTQIFNNQLEVVQTTLAEAIREESRNLERFIDDTFTAQFGSAIRTNLSEFIAVGSVGLLLLISWVVVLFTRRRTGNTSDHQ